MIIALQEKCEKKTITREHGRAVAEMIINALNQEDKITVDFGNILVASVSFFDEAFGKLAFKYPKEVLTEKLAFENIEEYDRALLNDILISRYHQKELGQNGFSKPTRRRPTTKKRSRKQPVS